MHPRVGPRAQPAAAAGADAIRQARGVVHALVEAHRESVALARQLMIAQEFADLHESQANHAIARAAADPSDFEAVRAAVEAAELAERANEDEARASDLWSGHVMRIGELIAAVERLPWINSVPGPVGTADESRPA